MSNLEHLDEAGITSIEVLQSVIEEIQAIENDSNSSISCRNLHPKAIVRRVRRVQRVLGMTRRRITRRRMTWRRIWNWRPRKTSYLVMVNLMLTHRYLIIPLSFLLGRLRRRVQCWGDFLAFLGKG